MENNNSIVFNNQPPFELPSGGSFVKSNLSSDIKKYYDDALKYAISKNDPNPEKFAKIVSESASQSYGKNNPFGELANKYESGTIKDGIKYKNYSTPIDPISKKYNQYTLEESTKQAESEMYNNIPQEQMVQDEQSNMEQIGEQLPVDNNFEQLNDYINIPNSPPTSLNARPDIYSKNYSDKQSQANNSVDNLQAINPIQQFAMGGNVNQSNDDDLNSYNVGGTHETNPYHGIPQGIGPNGKLNTVEQDETSFNIDGQKFIFSNRIKL